MTDHRLLILDDDPLVGQTIQSIAHASGFEAQMTTQPDEFFRQVERFSPTHIALDLVMPEMDGVEVMVELARRNCNARIIITSGVGGRVLDAAARSATAHGLTITGAVSKPFSRQALLEVLLKDMPKSGAQHPSPMVADPTDEITETRIRLALERGEFENVYQPKLHCADSTLCGFEALARWNDPQRGIILPEMFIPLAESTGLIKPMTRQVISQAMKWFARASRHCHHPDPAEQVTLAINLSARALEDSEFVEFAHEECAANQIDPRRISFELTETSAMQDPVESLDLLTRLRMKGFQLSIDDFGTGFSSMLQLVRLPFSEIKIDKSFVMVAPHSEEAQAVIRSIVELGHSLGLVATAEGVEDLETLEYLRKIGCDRAQGYYFSRPVDGDTIIEWMQQHLKSGK